MGGDPDTTGGYDANPGGRGKWISAIIGLLGLWMILQAVLFELTPGQFWNDVIVGALLLAVGGYNYYRRADERLGNIGAAALAALIGLWLVASPFVFGAGDTASGFAFWNDVLVGLSALVLGAYSAYKGRSRRRATARTA
ncbi:SPW repeat protein (plasmid) [Halorarum salinum]|uniref:SPW repeat protein n=2 Tax=Halorarum salinum TaxID=2743089 RepID=A0A7D5LE07_9EURY|nr:SPW repeat protein [Halobaculum salinum]